MEVLIPVGIVVAVIVFLIATNKNERRFVEPSDRPVGGSIDGTREN